MKINFSDELIYNVVSDWKKKEISPEEKSHFIKQYLKEKKLSQRKLAKLLDIPHSTLHDWVSMRQIGKTKSDKNVEIFNTMHNSTIYCLADRLIFLLTKSEDLTDKERRVLNLLSAEIEKKNILILEG